MNNEIKILFIGDIVGKPGRKTAANYLEALKSGLIDVKPDFIIANAENASHGFGLTQKNYNELISCGIDCLTSGNHIWDKKEIFKYIEKADKLVRPSNYPEHIPGKGARLFKLPDGTKIGVINILGRVFMNTLISPWEALEKEFELLRKETNIIFTDFHAEATAEKIALGDYADELGISAFVGTHTHVQTADEKILQNGCAYISDAGFCGTSRSVIGMDIQSSRKYLKTGIPERFDVAESDMTELNGVSITINKQTGHASSIERIKYVMNNNEENTTMEG